MKTDWAPLRRLLADYRRDAVALPVWWRDDDAIAPTPALEQLGLLAEKHRFPVHIAVIPGRAEESLARHVRGHAHLVPLVHGWRHENNAPPEAKKSEFGIKRPEGASELERSLSTMESLFGAQFLRVFVPPWNRFDSAYLPELAAAGYAGLSTYQPRRARYACAGVVQINTHIDPIDWRTTRNLRPTSELVEDIALRLTERLRGDADATEPLGYLTHHLVHTPELWEFTDQLLSELLDGGAVVQPIAPLLETRS